MSMEDLTKLVKILGYTTSSNDNEALNACRRANELMKSMNLTWLQLVTEKTIVVNEIVNKELPPTSQPTTQQKGSDPEVEMMLRVVLSKTNLPRASQSGREFLLSLDESYKKYGRLTPKQKVALQRWYENV